MWVTYRGQVGIVAGIGPQQAKPPFQKAIPAGKLDFHAVNPEGDVGETISEELADIRSVSQAALLDIPESRRRHITDEDARRLGYLGN
jgi:hypothetical protein